MSSQESKKRKRGEEGKASKYDYYSVEEDSKRTKEDQALLKKEAEEYAPLTASEEKIMEYFRATPVGRSIFRECLATFEDDNAHDFLMKPGDTESLELFLASGLAEESEFINTGNNETANKFARHAAAKGWWEGVFTIIKAMPDIKMFMINRVDGTGNTILSHAVRQGNIGAVERLLKEVPFANPKTEVSGDELSTLKNIDEYIDYPLYHDFEFTASEFLRRLADRLGLYGVSIINLAERLYGRDDMYYLLRKHERTEQFTEEEYEEWQNNQ